MVLAGDPTAMHGTMNPKSRCMNSLRWEGSQEGEWVASSYIGSWIANALKSISAPYLMGHTMDAMVAAYI